MSWWWFVVGFITGSLISGIVTTVVVTCIDHILWVISSGGLEPEPLPNEEDEDN